MRCLHEEQSLAVCTDLDQDGLLTGREVQGLGDEAEVHVLRRRHQKDDSCTGRRHERQEDTYVDVCRDVGEPGVRERVHQFRVSRLGRLEHRARELLLDAPQARHGGLVEHTLVKEQSIVGQVAQAADGGGGRLVDSHQGGCVRHEIDGHLHVAHGHLRGTLDD